MRFHLYKMTTCGKIAASNLITFLLAYGIGYFADSETIRTLMWNVVVVLAMPLALAFDLPGPIRVAPNTSTITNLVPILSLVANAYLWGFTGSWLIEKWEIRRSPRLGR